MWDFKFNSQYHMVPCTPWAITPAPLSPSITNWTLWTGEFSIAGSGLRPLEHFLGDPKDIPCPHPSHHWQKKVASYLTIIYYTFSRPDVKSRELPLYVNRSEENELQHAFWIIITAKDEHRVGVVHLKTLSSDICCSHNWCQVGPGCCRLMRLLCLYKLKNEEPTGSFQFRIKAEHKESPGLQVSTLRFYSWLPATPPRTRPWIQIRSSTPSGKSLGWYF